MASAPVALTALEAGRTARFVDARLDEVSIGLLRALGLWEAESFRVCKVGEPCILQVGETRIGVSHEVASHIFVIPDAPVA